MGKRALRGTRRRQMHAIVRALRPYAANSTDAARCRLYIHRNRHCMRYPRFHKQLRIGFLHHQQIIWDKGRAVLTRTHYWFQHEPCWYVRKKNAPWYGKAGENSTIWDSPSPKFVMGEIGRA